MPTIHVNGIDLHYETEEDEDDLAAQYAELVRAFLGDRAREEVVVG